MKCLVAVLACFVAVAYAEDCLGGNATACKITSCGMAKVICEEDKCTCPAVTPTVVPPTSVITCLDMQDCSGACDATTMSTDPHHHPKPHHEEPHHTEPHGPGHHHEEHGSQASFEPHCLDGQCKCLQLV